MTSVVPSGIVLKRAVDLFPNAPEGADVRQFTMSQFNAESVLGEIRIMSAACVKLDCPTNRSRSGMILYKGKVLGAIHSSVEKPETVSTEESLLLMMDELKLPATETTVYELPESIVLSMAALFTPDAGPRNEKLASHESLKSTLTWAKESQGTLCLSLSLPGSNSTALVFVHHGRFESAYNIDLNQYVDDIDDVYAVLRADPNSTVQADVLPAELASGKVPFGLNL